MRLIASIIIVCLTILLMGIIWGCDPPQLPAESEYGLPYCSPQSEIPQCYDLSDYEVRVWGCTEPVHSDEGTSCLCSGWDWLPPGRFVVKGCGEEGRTYLVEERVD
jgi:hypothetical protein